MTSYLIELTNGTVHKVQADDLLSLHNQILVLKRKNCIYDDDIVSIKKDRTDRRIQEGIELITVSVPGKDDIFIEIDVSEGQQDIFIEKPGERLAIIRNANSYSPVADFKDKVGTNTTASIEGFNDYATIVSGGECGLKVTELTEDNWSLIWYLLVHALLDRNVETPSGIKPQNYDDFLLDHIPTEQIIDTLNVFSGSLDDEDKG
jgi:hypothetical protein